MAYCETTRQQFAGLFTKPVLTDKVLQRPPFKFIHDVVAATAKNSNFAQGLFTDELGDTANIKDKDQKIAYLTRLIEAVQFANEKKIDVKPAKIVAGLEPEKTNVLLQAIANAARTIDAQQNSIIVKRVLDGDKYDGPSSAGSNKENRQATEAKPEKREKNIEKKPKVNKEEKKAKSDKASLKEVKKHTSTDGKKTRSTSREKSDKAGEKSPKKTSKKDGETKRKSNKHAKEAKQELLSSDSGAKSGETSREPSGIDLDTSAPAEKAPARATVDGDLDLETPVLPRSPPRSGTAMARPGTASGARPGTARAAPPRVKRRELGAVSTEAEAPQEKETANIIASAADENDKEDEFVVEATADDEQIMGAAADLAANEAVDADTLDAQEHGVLVRKILETKKELESGLADDMPAATASTVVFDERERERVRNETRKVQNSIQTLTRAAHPLARLLDYLQEDIDAMSAELEQWRNERKANELQLRRLTDASHDPVTTSLRSKIAELQAQIDDAQEACAALRTKLAINDEKLRNLVQNVTGAP